MPWAQRIIIAAGTWVSKIKATVCLKNSYGEGSLSMEWGVGRCPRVGLARSQKLGKRHGSKVPHPLSHPWVPRLRARCAVELRARGGPSQAPARAYPHGAP